MFLGWEEVSLRILRPLDHRRRQLQPANGNYLDRRNLHAVPEPSRRLRHRLHHHHRYPGKRIRGECQQPAPTRQRPVLGHAGPSVSAIIDKATYTSSFDPSSVASFVYTIASAPTLTGVSLATTGGVTGLMIGQTNQLAATCSYSDGSMTSCNTADSHGNYVTGWASSNPSRCHHQWHRPGYSGCHRDGNVYRNGRRTYKCGAPADGERGSPRYLHHHYHGAGDYHRNGDVLMTPQCEARRLRAPSRRRFWSN